MTLLHSRTRLLPRLDEAMHAEIVATLSSLNVRTVLGDRLDLDSLAAKHTRTGERVVRTLSGREIAADLVVSIRRAVQSRCRLWLIITFTSAAALHGPNAQHRAPPQRLPGLCARGRPEQGHGPRPPHPPARGARPGG